MGVVIKNYIFFLFVIILMYFPNTVFAGLIEKEKCNISPDRSDGLSSWYYKVTVSINTPDGMKSGSAIWHESWVKDQQSPVGVAKKIEREAIPINIDGSKIIFAILKGSHGHNRLPFVSVRQLPCELPRTAKTHLDTDKYIMNYVGTEQKVHPINYPDIVYFKNIDDPDSLEIIYANNKKSSEKPLNRFAEILGTGFSFRGVTVTIVDDSVDWKLQNYIPWIEDTSSPNLGYFREGFYR